MPEYKYGDCVRDTRSTVPRDVCIEMSFSILLHNWKAFPFYFERNNQFRFPTSIIISNSIFPENVGDSGKNHNHSHNYNNDTESQKVVAVKTAHQGLSSSIILNCRRCVKKN